jgi:hypothetical protein
MSNSPVTRSTGGAASVPEPDIPGILKEQFANASVAEKIALVVTLLINLPLFVLGALLQKYYWGGRDNHPNGTLESVAPNVFQFPYWGDQSNTTIVQGRDGGLFVHLPGPLQPETVAKLQKIGPIKVIFTSASHNTYAAAWSKKFPEAVLVAPVSPCPGVNAPVALLSDKKIEATLRENWGIQALDVSAWTHLPDALFNITIAGKKVALLPCGVGHQPLTWFRTLTWYLFVGGFAGLRCFRQYALMFCKHPQQYQAALRSAKDAQIVLFQHGKPLKGGAPMADIVMSRSLFYFPWPFER